MSPSRRVKITSPQTRVALNRRHRPHPHPLPLPAPADVDQARWLFHTQRRLAVRTVALLAVVLFGVSGLIAAFPALDRHTLLGMPVSWLMLAVLTYPVLLVLALAHVWAAERTENRAGRRPGEPDNRPPARPRPAPSPARRTAGHPREPAGTGSTKGDGERAGTGSAKGDGERAAGARRTHRSGDRERGTNR